MLSLIVLQDLLIARNHDRYCSPTPPRVRLAARRPRHGGRLGIQVAE
jgi:hypothetical protein